MQSFLQFVNAGIGHFNRLIGWGLALLLLVMTVLIFWQVFARFVVGSPLFFSDEIARFSMLWLTFIGAGYAYRKGTLISVGDKAVAHNVKGVPLNTFGGPAAEFLKKAIAARWIRDVAGTARAARAWPDM